MAKASFETAPRVPGEDPFRPAAEPGQSVGKILFGRPDTTVHQVPGHWVNEGGEKPAFYPDADYVARMRGENPAQH